jgi:hypothetical protein
MGVSVVVAHFGGLDLPVGGAVLDDAEGVDPEVEDLEGPADVDGVLEDGGEAEPGDGFF